MTDLELQHPHVHEWHSQDGIIHVGPLAPDGPPLACDCGEGMGDWSRASVFITVTADFNLNVRDVWPDGDHPVPVTSESVRDLMEKCGSKRRVLDDWCLLDDLTVEAQIPGDEWVEVWVR